MSWLDILYFNNLSQIIKGEVLNKLYFICEFVYESNNTYRLEYKMQDWFWAFIIKISTYVKNCTSAPNEVFNIVCVMTFGHELWQASTAISELFI